MCCVDSIVAIMPRPGKGLWITCPEWFSSIILQCHGLDVPASIAAVDGSPAVPTLAGLRSGVIYTIGGVMYLKLPSNALTNTWAEQ